ncbi:Sec-independent protein translocase subunit TatA [Streptomyces sp. RS10V-4]|uniref:Sec-independent protein translocase subunit TatA n=1 Tax=Streptomyces rhizoryzae TaxID=2932493 RepID=UPI0020060E75|nr:Sec-independent protein translocase subunit TatA [Streptomyces rhizoryzae]MCK7622612.1 Sec-independent protein translocase subunit TatA [Streptomyces rhizoryzae]
MLRNGLEPWHLLIVALVVILLFGSKKLPDTARALGKSLRILKSEATAMKHDDGTPPTATHTAGPAAPAGSAGPQAPAEAPRTLHPAPGAAATGSVPGGTDPEAPGTGRPERESGPHTAP